MVGVPREEIAVLYKVVVSRTRERDYTMTIEGDSTGSSTGAGTGGGSASTTAGAVGARTKGLLSQLEPALFNDSNVAKIWHVASAKLRDISPPTEYPEYAFGRYSYRPVDYWTAGFFPGSVAALVERAHKYPSRYPSQKLHPLKLEHAANWWAEGLVGQAPRTDTHDLSFMIQPAFQRKYQHDKDPKALECLKTAARALASRFSPSAGVIRSWDTAENHRYSFTDLESDFIVIIDNMCNLDMLYYVASVTGDLELATIATTHAESTAKHHFRTDKPDEEWSTYHVVNYEAVNGIPKAKFTNQGYEDESTWSRGQAWAIMGFAETYHWTKARKFLEVAIGAGEYFLDHLPEDGVPPWDFQAPDSHVKDTSAAMVAAVGLLLIYQATEEEKYLVLALKLVLDTVEIAFLGDGTWDKASSQAGDSSVSTQYDTILAHATTNNNPDTFKKLVDHGLVYGDYYFLVFGNKLLEMGFYE